MTNAVALKEADKLALFADIPEVPSDLIDLPQEQRLVIFWKNGDARQKNQGDVYYTGGWCIDAEKVSPDDLNPSVWNLLTMTSESGNEYEVYAAQVIEAAILGFRESWRTKEPPIQHFKDYGVGLRHYTELACAVRGVKKAVVLTASGYNAGYLKSAYSRAATTVNRALGRNVAPFAFYLPLGGEVDDKGLPVFTGSKEKKSPIVHIVPRFPETVDYAWLKAHRTPSEVFESLQASLYMLKAWKVERFKQAEAVEIVEEDNGF